MARHFIVCALSKGLLYGAGEFLDGASYSHVNRWTEEIGKRSAVKRGAHGQSHPRRRIEPAPRAP